MMESEQENYHGERLGSSDHPARPLTASLSNRKPKTLSPTKRPRNLRVVLENVDYRESCNTSDIFSIKLALARMSRSKCSNLRRTPAAYDCFGKTDEKLTILRSLIEHHLHHCQHCRDQMEDLDYFEPEEPQQDQELWRQKGVQNK